MASDQFVIEMHRKLHPRSKRNSYDELLPHHIDEVMDIVNKKHEIKIVSEAAGVEVTIDLNTLRNIMTQASLAASAGMRKQEEKSISDIQNPGGGWDHEAMKDWQINYRYYVDQKHAVDRIESEVLDALRDATNQEGFYLS